MKNTIAFVIASLLVPLVVARAEDGVKCAPKPNIVHILVDDLGWQDVASHKMDGKPVYETPNLDRLTKKGRRFTQAYSPAPSCSPSRAAFLRGQYPVHTGVYHVGGGEPPRRLRDQIGYVPPFYLGGLQPDDPTIPKVLKKAGYVSGQVGKWHLGGKQEGYPFPINQGFDFGFAEKDGSWWYNDPDLWNPADAKRNQSSGSWTPQRPNRLSFATDDPDDPFQLNEDGRPFDKPLDMALGFIRKHKDQPFFLNFCTLFVHGPIGTRDRDRLEKYCKKMGYDFPTDPGAINAGKTGQTNPYYASMVDSLDWIVGEVVDLLERTDDPRNPGHKLIDNTYVILDSDNGGWIGSPAEPVTDNSPLRAGKQTTYEGGIRIPFIVRGPGVPAGSTCDAPIHLIDLFPTFLSMAGVAADPELKLDGCDILPLMTGASDKVIQGDGTERQALYWYFPFESHMSLAMRKGDWKLVRNFGVFGGNTRQGNVELYRLYNEDGSESDLGEKNDLSEKEPERRDAMRSELEAFLARAGAPMPYRNLAGPFVTDEERAAAPGILELGSSEDMVWTTFETGEGKAAIAHAQLLYTMNPKPFCTSINREEWFPLPAEIGAGRVEAVMPPGATHAIFYLTDVNGFLVTSEPLPSWDVIAHECVASEYLKNGFAYRPGLFALIRLGKQAVASASERGKDDAALVKTLAVAEKVYESGDATGKMYCDAIRDVRRAIRNQEDIPEAKNPYINRFPTEPLF